MAENPLLLALKRSPARLTNLDDEEDEGNSLLGEIGRRSLSGLQKTANALDIVGSMSRDVLVGANPFDQLLDPLGDSNRTSGRDLLRTYGMIGQRDTTANWWGALLAEGVTDPFSWTTLGAGALTKSGKVAKAAGLLGDAGRLTGKGTRVARLTTTLKELATAAGPEATNALTEAAAKAGTTLDDVGEETLGSLARIGIPFTDVGVNVGTGPLAQRAAGLLDTAGEAIRWSPLGRAAHGLFGPGSKGLFDKGGQELAEAVSALEPSATRQARKAVADIAGPLTDAYKAFDEIFHDDVMRGAVDTAAPGVGGTWREIGPDEILEPGRKVDINVTTGKRSVFEPGATTPSKLKTAVGAVKAVDPTSHVASVLNRTVGLVAELGGDVDEAFKQMSLPLGKLTPELRSKLVKLGDDMQKGEDDIADLLIQKGGNLKKMEGLAAGVDPVVGAQSARVREMAQKVSPDSADATMAIMDAHARMWAKQTGKTADEWYSRISDIKQGDAPKTTGPDTLFQSKATPAFYSKLAQTVASKVGGSTTEEQLLATLKNAGVKEEELRDSGIKALFAGRKSVPKGEIEEFLAENAVEVKEIVKEEKQWSMFDKDTWPDDIRKKHEEIVDLRDRGGRISAVEAQRRLNAMWEGVANGHTKFQEYAIPGGENYRELLLTIPKRASQNDLYDQVNNLRHEAHAKYGDGWVLKQPAEAQKLLDLERQAELAAANPNYRGPHFQEPNVLASVRMDDVTLPDGTKTLRVQEIQSDWHQSGKKMGYGTSGAVPDGPFKQSWSSLAIKHILKFAAEKGYDAVGLVKGADIATAVGGPPSELGKFYDEVLTNDLKKYTKKWGSHVGEAEIPRRKTFLDELQFTDIDTGGALPGGGVAGAADDIVGGVAAGWDEIDGKTFTGKMQVFQITDAMRDDIVKKGQPLYQSGRGMVEFAKDGKAAITAFTNAADKSTLIHETAHIFRRSLAELTDSGLLQKAEKELGVSNGNWTRDAEEKFATQFEKYLADGKAPTSALNDVFQKFKTWLVDVYRNIVGTPLADRLNPKLKEVFDSMLKSGDDYGASPALEHLTAYGAEKPATFGGAFKTLFTKAGAFSAREEVTKNIPREIVNQIVSSDEFRGRGATQKLLEKYGKYLGRGTELLEDGTKKPIWESADKHAKALVDFIKNRDQFPIYNSNQLENYGRYMKESHLANVNYDVIHETLAKNLDDVGIPVKEVFSKAGMEPTKAMEWLAKKVGISAEELAAKGIPEDVANSIVAVRKASSDPEWMGAIGGFVDTVTKMFKENVTLPFPAFSGRNLSSGQYVNAVSGLLETPSDFTAYGNSLKQAFNGLRSGDSKLLSELFVEGVIDDRMLSEGVEASRGLGYAAGQVPNPLNVRQSFGEASEEVAANPFMRGLDTARAVHGTVLKTGEKTSAMVEFMNRVPMYLFLREKGWAPEVAAAKVKELHIDYSALSPFEKQVMKRLVPFYSFQRKMAPALLSILAERPGGAMAQTIRASSQSSGADATTPNWVASTMAVPNPFKTPTEGQSFLTGFGLPFEQFLQYGEGGLRGVLREGLSQVNPLVKAPLEMATNQSFFQTGPSGAGRPLDDLDPVLGRTLANIAGRFGRESTKPVQTNDTLEWALSNSPLTRAASTLRQVTDPRKSPLDLALNLGTGVRVTDVSPAAQDAVLRDRALEMMKAMGSRAFTRTYFDKDDVSQMPAPTRALAEKLTQLQSLLAERAKERRVAANR
jgi:hypothetical protein